MGKILRFFSHFILAGFLFAIAAEAISHLFLPAPIIQKLPMMEHITHPVCGYKLKPNQTGYILDQQSTTNNFGYRDKNWSIEKPAGTVRVAIVGASFAFGHGVKDGEVFPRRLEDALNKTTPAGKHFEVMNFGVPGYDTGHMVCMLKEEVLQFKPDVVLLTFFLNELFYIKDYSFYPEMFRLEKINFKKWKWDLLNFARHSRLAQYFWDILKYRLRMREPDEVAAVIDAYVKQGVLPPDGPKADGWKFVEEKLSELSALSKEHSFKAYFLVTPPYQEILDKKTKSSYAYYLADRCRENGIEPLLLVEALKASHLNPKDYLIPYDYHMKPLGHQFVADFVAERIRMFLNKSEK